MEKNSAGSAVRKKRRILAAFLLLAAAMAAGILLNICIGSVSVSLSEILKILSGRTPAVQRSICSWRIFMMGRRMQTF